MQRQMLIIKLDGDHYGVDVRLIQEVIKNYSLRPLPDAPNFVEGIVSLRDSIIPLIKIKRLLNTPLFDLYKHKKVIILNFGEGVKIGIMVDEVVGIHYYDDSDIRPMDTVSRSNVIDYVMGIVHLEDKKVAILDVFSMFFTNKGDFLYTQYFKKGAASNSSLSVSKKDYYMLKERMDKIDFPFNDFTQKGIIKFISRVAAVREEPIEKVLKNHKLFESSHFSLEQKRNIFFENQGDMYMINDIFDSLVKKKKKIRVWVIGNGRGEDAYSLSTLFHAFEDSFREIEIINSDDNLDALQEGQKLKLNKRALGNLPLELWDSYFETSDKKTYAPNKKVKSSLIFDFYKPNPQFNPSDIDLIYAPNVLARYSDQMEMLIKTFYRSLNSGGILALGLFENIEGLVKNLKKYYIKNRLVFIKEQ